MTRAPSLFGCPLLALLLWSHLEALESTLDSAGAGHCASAQMGFAGKLGRMTKWGSARCTLLEESQRVSVGRLYSSSLGDGYGKCRYQKQK